MVTLRARRTRNVAADLTLGAVLPLAATAVLAGQRVLGTVVLGVCLLVLALRWWQERRRLEFRWAVLGQYPELRGLATACVAAVVVGPGRDASDIVWAALATAVLVTLLVLEPKIAERADERIPVVVNLPDVPTAMEQGMQGRLWSLEGGLPLMAPAGTPEAVLQALSRVVVQGADSDRAAKLRETFAIPNKPKDLKATRADWDRDVPVWVKLAVDLGIKLD